MSFLDRKLFYAAGGFFSLLFLLLFFSAPAWAYTVETNTIAAAGSSDLSPAEIQINLPAGEKTSRDVSITNKSEQILSIQFKVEDFRGPGDPSRDFEFFGNESIPRGARKFITPEVTGIVLKPRESLTMKVTIEIPQNTDAGGYYAALFASTSYKPPDQKPITGESKSLFLISVPGAVVEQGSLDRPEIAGPTIRGPVDIGLIFNNLGNLHLEPSGRIFISNFQGQDVDTLPVEQWLVLPGSSKQTKIQWSPGFQFGRFTARAEIDYGSAGNHLVASQTFWVFPWPVLAAFGVLLLLAGLLIFKTVRNRYGYSRPSRKTAEVYPGGLSEAVAQKQAAAKKAETGAAAEEAAPPSVQVPVEPVSGAEAASGVPEMFPLQQVPEYFGEAPPTEEAPELEEPSAAEKTPAPGGQAAAEEAQAPAKAPAEAEKVAQPRIPASLERFYTAPAEKIPGKEEAGIPEVESLEKAAGKYVSLGELFPSMDDDSIVDLSDPETESLTKQLLYDQLELARALMSQGNIEESRNQFLDARSAATHLQLFSEAAMIDDILRWL